MKTLHCGRYRLSLDRPRIMGIVNLTPDSFSGDGAGADVERAIAMAHFQIESGADILDLGAESSRPGAKPVTPNEELERLLPLLRALRDVSVPISVDTGKAEVMRAVLSEGAAMINDISALREEGAVAALVASDAAVCLMHMQGEPRTMQAAPSYADVVVEVRDFLADRVEECRRAGIPLERIVVDPGFGFGKTLAHNLALLRQLDELVPYGLPLVAGISRKSMLGEITGRPVADRLPASLAAAILAVAHGAAIVRVHDVMATRDALAVWTAVENGQ
jgi:dihydropteroate synthase